MATVTFQNASRIFTQGARPAVDSLNLEIHDGEFLVLVGPSGCGKSTTLRMLAGLEPIDTGEVFIGTRDVTDVAPGDRDIAMVFQSYALYPQMTVGENIGFPLLVKKMPKAEIAARVKEAADLLEIPFERFTQVALLPVAYFTGQTFSRAERIPGRRLTHWDRWGNHRS